MAYNYQYSMNDVFEARGATYVIASRRYVTRGKYAGRLEIGLAPIEGGKANEIGLRAKVKQGQPFPGLTPSEKKYTPKAVEAAAVKSFEKKRARDESVLERTRRCRDVVDSKDIHEGDIVTVRWSNSYPTEHEIVGVNWATGKVAIYAPRNKNGKRWIPATSILSAKPAPEYLPTTLTGSERSTLAEKGWVQVRRGREFIECSFVVAKTAADARRNGIDYEVASRRVHFDARLDVFWRATGRSD